MRARALVVVAVALLAGGCGSEDVERGIEDVRTSAERLREDVEERVRAAREQFEERRERYGRRIEEVLGELERVFERPERTNPNVRSPGLTERGTIEAFLTDVLGEVDAYWTRTFAEGGLPEPRVAYLWVAEGRAVRTGCGAAADDLAALYCPADDTIYIGQRFAAALYQGVLQGLPGDGRAAGDFAVAYVVAHEYAHNLQHELGVFDNRSSPTARPFELQADCLAGVWAYSVYAEGLLSDEDLREATDAARAVGDFDVTNEQHHGTPDERQDALLTGFRSGDPSACTRYLPA